MQEAQELFQQAANCYKVGGNWVRAIECYSKCVDCETEDRNKG